MVTLDFTNLFVVAIVAFIAPVLAGLLPGGWVAPVVLEVVAGIVVGPEGFGLVKADQPIQVLSLMGLGFLLFLAGMDIEPARMRGSTMRSVAAAFALSALVAVPAALALRLVDHHADVRLLALALVSSSLGVVIPILRDSGALETDFGQLVVVAATTAEFGSLLLLTVLFSAEPQSTLVQVAFVVVMAVAAGLAAFGIRALWRSGILGRAMTRMDDTTSQLRVRAAFVVLLLFAGLAHHFGVDAILGAFVAGMVLRFSDEDSRPSIERYHAKLDAVGFGFLIPVFFVTTGIDFHLKALTGTASALVLLPLILAGIMLARVAPALLYRERLGLRPAMAAGWLQGTTLTFPVVVATVGNQLHLLDDAASAALIGAGLLSVLLMPAAAMALRPWGARPAADPAPVGDAFGPVE